MDTHTHELLDDILDLWISNNNISWLDALVKGIYWEGVSERENYRESKKQKGMCYCQGEEVEIGGDLVWGPINVIKASHACP